MTKGTLVIDSSTIAAATSQKVAQAAQAAGIDFIDAPVSGGVGGAVAGTLTFMVGASATQLERARPVLEKMGANIFHAGDIGAGQTAKICNNMLLGILMIGTSEAMALGVANGLDPKVLAEIMRRSSGGNWALEKYNPYPGVHESCPGQQGLRRRLWHRPDAQRPGPGARKRHRRQSQHPPGRPGPFAVRCAQPGRAWRRRLLQRDQDAAKTRVKPPPLKTKQPPVCAGGFFYGEGAFSRSHSSH